MRSHPSRLSLVLSLVFRKRSLVPLAMGALSLLSANAAGDSPVDDGAPRGTVAFFMMAENNICPLGWVPAASATGRLVVGVTNGDRNGIQVGKPLADSEDRTHAHPYSSSVTWPFKSVSAADGGNQQAAAAATAYSVMGDTAAAPSGLPFIQLLVCEKK